jgi:predicted GIY-YIG superfamily endonuclease
LPVVLVYYQQFLDITQAIVWEKRIKNWSQKKKRALISENWEKLKEYLNVKMNLLIGIIKAPEICLS